MITKLKVKNDFIFNRIFGRNENKEILLSLLNAILEPKDWRNVRGGIGIGYERGTDHRKGWKGA